MINPYIVIKPVITEKSLRLANSENTYVFKVQAVANKNQIKEAIETLFSVRVQKIRTIMSYKKLKRTGKKRIVTRFGKTKKALVTLDEGQSIDLFDISKEK